MDGSNRVLFLGPLFLLSPPTLGLLPLRNDVQVLWKEPQSGCVTQFQRGGEGGREREEEYDFIFIIKNHLCV